MLKKGIFAFPILFYMRIQKCLNNSYMGHRTKRVF